MKQKRTVFIIAALTAALFSGCAAESSNTLLQEPIYNSAHVAPPQDIVPPQNSDPEESALVTSKTAVHKTPEEIELSPVTDIRTIKQGNSFEENNVFGHFCSVENGFYFVDLNDWFLYFMDKDGNRKSVLKDYVRALNYYDGFLYYIKGKKEDFQEWWYFFPGSIWRLDPNSGEEVCLIDVPKNLSLVVNEYGIFCYPNGGGVALYNFDGKEIKRISNENQGIYIMGNKMRLKKSGEIVLYDLDTGEESDFPYYQYFTAYIGDRVVCSDENDQWTKVVLNLSDGSVKALPKSDAFTFAVCGNELYGADNYNLYRVDFEKMEYESIISYPLGDPIYFFDLHSDGSRLYAVMFNQQNVSKLAEVDLNNGELKYLEGEL